LKLCPALPTTYLQSRRPRHHLVAIGLPVQFPRTPRHLGSDLFPRLIILSYLKMTIHDTKPPMNPSQTLGLTRDQVNALHTYGSKATRNALLTSSPSSPALANPLVTCLICIHPYHSTNVDGNVETPVITACGHVFGDECLEEWLQGNGAGSCPLCRFVLKYRNCEHGTLLSPISFLSQSMLTLRSSSDQTSACLHPPTSAQDHR
jgi:hypothetical protein